MGSFFKGSDGKQTTENNPWAPSIPHLEKILGEMGGWYDSAKNEGYISQTGNLDDIYGGYLNSLQEMNKGNAQTGQDAINQGMAGLQGTQDFYNKLMNGGSDITSEDINNMANDFINSDLLNSQIDAANRDTARALYEDALPSIDRDASANGAMGSSRAGVSAAIAERSTNERMADTSAAMRGQAHTNALNQAQSVLQGNISNQINGATNSFVGSNNMINQGANYGNNMMGTLSGQMTSAQLQAMLQGVNQADKIGNRDYLANLLGQYSGIAGGIGGMGGTSTSTIKNPGTSMFDKLLQVGSVASGFYGGGKK